MLHDKSPELFDRPVFIVSSPRSASSLLFQTLAQSPDVSTIGGESHNLIESVAGLHPRERAWASNRLEAVDATNATSKELGRRFFQALRDRDGRAATAPTIMLEKTPKNSLRVPFFKAAFPDARFIYLYRDPRATVSSMIEAWTTGRFRTYPMLPDWTGLPWSLLLVPGWRDLHGLPLNETVAHQWAQTTATLLADLDALPLTDVVSVAHDEFLTAPQAIITGLCAFLKLRWDRDLPSILPLSPTVVSEPNPEKWRTNEKAIEAIWPIISDVDIRARAALNRFRKISA